MLARWVIAFVALASAMWPSWAAAQGYGRAPGGMQRQPTRLLEAVEQAAYSPAAHQEMWESSGEPLGFSGARMQPAMPDPEASYGVLDETYGPPLEEPMDPEGPAPATSSGEWVKTGLWYTDQNVTYMDRSTNVRNSIILARDVFATPLPHDNFFLQIPLGLGFQPGMRSTIGRFIGRDVRNRDHSVEFTFLGLTHWGASGGLTSLTGNGLYSPIDPSVAVPAFNGSAFQTFNETSDFNSFEVNYRINRRLDRDKLIYTRDSTWVRSAQPNLLPSVYAGIRGIGINETLNWFAQSDTPFTKGYYQVWTHNVLVGPQVGLDVFYERTDWRIGVRMKGASLVNWATQDTRVRIVDRNGDPAVPNRDEGAKEHDAAFAGELSFVGAYHIRQNFALRFSYDMMWVTNLALAQNQLTFVQLNPPEISAGHALFYQGLTFGFELAR